MIRARVAVIQFPGVNCEAESVRALQRVGIDAEVFRWKRPATELRDFQAYLLPGGFSYQDRVRAGALAAKDPLMDVLAEETGRGKPAIGICNGAQVLVEAGLVPGGRGVDLALARNRMSGRSGYFSRWVYLRVEASSCVFTRHLEPGTILPLPMAHGEGRFTGPPGFVASLVESGRAPLRYATPDGALAHEFPANPNGAEQSVAAICNARGTVMAVMPHPERAQDLGALARALSGPWAERRDALLHRGEGGAEAPGPGLEVFRGLGLHLQEA